MSCLPNFEEFFLQLFRICYMMNNHNPQSFTSVELSHEEQHGAKLTFKTDKLIRHLETYIKPKCYVYILKNLPYGCYPKVGSF